MQDSTLLHATATSTMSEWWAVPLFIWIASLVIVRSVVLVDKRAVDRVTHQWVWWMLLTAALREPWTQHVLIERCGLELSDVRVLTHTAALGGAAAIAVLALYWREHKLPAPHLLHDLYLVAAVLGALLWIVSLPARRDHIAIEEFENWRTGTYMAIYSIPTPAAETIVFLTALGLVRERSTGPRLMFGVLVLLAICASMIDHLTRLAVAIFLSFGVHNGLTDARDGTANDLLFLPVLAGLSFLMLPSMVASMRIRQGHDPSSRAVQVLAPVWMRMTEALPAYRLNQTHSLDSPVEQEHRMRIEIEDTIEALNRYLAPNEQWPADPLGRARLLEKCIARYEAGTHTAVDGYAGPPEWLQSENQVDAMAAAWSEHASQLRV